MCSLKPTFSSITRADLNPHDVYRPALGRVLLIRQLLPWVSDLGPPSFRKWIAQTVPWPDLNRFVEIVDVMHNTSSKIFAQKKAAFEKGEDAVVHQIAEGRDIMSVLSESLLCDLYLTPSVLKAMYSASEYVSF